MSPALRAAVLAVLAAAPVLPALAAAPGIALDARESMVNSHTAGDQKTPAIARDATGNYVVVWNSFDQVSGSSGEDIYGQRYNAAGQPQGSEFLINTFTSNAQISPRVAMDATGDFVVAWQSEDQAATTSNYDVYARQYKADGTPLQAHEFLVNTFTSGYQGSPDVAMDSAGDFVIAWNSYDEASPTSLFDIYARRYDKTGTALTGEFPVNTITVFEQQSPRVAMDATGDFVVAWEAYNQASGTSLLDIYARSYGSDGTPEQLSEMQVNTFTSGNQTALTVAMDATGDFVVVWQSNAQASVSSQFDVYARQYQAGGTAVQSSEFLVNTYTTNQQFNPAVAMDAAGDFAVVWESTDQPAAGTLEDIYTRLYRADGAAVESKEFLLNTLTSEQQQFPAVAMDAAGDFVAVWQSNDKSVNDYNIFARRYAGLGKVDMTGSLSASPTSVRSGESVTLSVGIDNKTKAGTSIGNAEIDAALASASSITATFSLPAGITPTTSGSDWTCGAPNGGSMSCSYGGILAAGSTAPVLTASFAAPTSAGNLPFKVMVDSAQQDSASTTASAQVTVKAASGGDSASGGGGGALDLLSLALLGLPLLRRCLIR
jgi:hypothetical protein